MDAVAENAKNSDLKATRIIVRATENKKNKVNINVGSLRSSRKFLK